jgi:hypothetical protein
MSSSGGHAERKGSDQWLSPEQAVRLPNRELRDVPTEPGCYAAWALNQPALSDAGIDGQVPKRLYVGKAAGGLRRRPRRHVDGTLPGLANLLAAEGTVLFSFGDWYQPDLVGRMAHLSY